MPDPSLAAKAIIVKDSAVLFLKRRPNDPHNPGKWDIPGGRLNLGENPFLGLGREIKEETDLEVEIKKPLEIQYFTRDDGQIITLIIFLCSPKSETITLSEEHTEYKWVKPDSGDPALFPDWLRTICADLIKTELRPDSVKLRHRDHEDRPWGFFDRFTVDEATSVKLLYVKPNQALSLQYHNQRDEFNRVLKGSATLMLGDEERQVAAGDEYWVERKMVHRLTAGGEGCQWLEISFGDFDENDIVRLEDRYQRVKP